MQGVHLRKYGVEAKIDFVLYEVDGVDFRTNWTPAEGDVFMMRDEAAEEQVTNASGNADLSTLVTDEGRGYSITLALEDLQAKRVEIFFVDQATKVFLDWSIIIETYGHASAQHAFDLDAASVTTDSASRTASKATGFAVANDVTTAHSTTDGLLATIAGYIDTEIADILAAVDTEVAAIVEAVITNAAGTDIAADIIALKLVADAVKIVTDWQRSCSGTVVVNNPGTDTIFDLTAVIGTLSTDNDSPNNMVVTIFDISGDVKETRKVTDFDGGNGRITIDSALTFPVQDGVDTFFLWNKYSPTAAAGGGATVQQIIEAVVTGVTTPGQLGYEIQQGGSHLT